MLIAIVLAKLTIKLEEKISKPNSCASVNDRLYCPKESDSRNFVWNEIIAESVSVQPCQSGSTGKVIVLFNKNI